MPAVAVERPSAPRPTARPARRASKRSGCDVRPRRISSPPGRTCRRMAISLHIVPRGQEHRGLVAEQRRHALLERVHGRVVAALLVADLGRGHRRAHRRGRTRLGVGVEVDHCRLSSTKSRMAATPTSEGRRTRLAEQRKRCPTARASTCSATPGARSSTSARPSRSRSASPATSRNPVTRGAVRDGRRDRVGRVHPRRQPRPRRCSPSRTSSSSTGRASTSACATTSPIRSSRSRWTRSSRASTSRASATAATALYFGPYSNAKRVRGTLDLLGEGLPVPLLPGRRARAALGLAVPGLLHQALRGALRRLRRHARSTARRSTASSRSSPAATARSSATSRSA